MEPKGSAEQGRERCTANSWPVVASHTGTASLKLESSPVPLFGFRVGFQKNSLPLHHSPRDLHPALAPHNVNKPFSIPSQLRTSVSVECLFIPAMGKGSVTKHMDATALCNCAPSNAFKLTWTQFKEAR